MAYSVAPLLPIVALGGLLEAISGFIIPLIFVLIWIISAIANQVAKASRKAETPEEVEKRQEMLRERRRRMEVTLGMPPGSIREADERDTEVEARPDPIRPVAGGRVAMPEFERPEMEAPRERRPDAARDERQRQRERAERQPMPVPTPPPIRKPAPKSEPITAAQTGEIGDSEITDVIGESDAIPTKRRHPVADLLRNPKTVQQVIAAKAVLDRPQW